MVNNSPYTIVGFWVAPADSNNWEENVLAGTPVGKEEVQSNSDLGNYLLL